MEAVKVRVQTQPGFARGLSDGLPKFIKADGVSGYAFWSLIFVSKGVDLVNGPLVVGVENEKSLDWGLGKI